MSEEEEKPIELTPQVVDRNPGDLRKWLDKCPEVSSIAEMVDLLSEAHELYVSKGYSTKQLHQHFPQVQRRVFTAAARVYGWDKAREDHVRQIAYANEEAMQEVVLKHRSDVVEEISTKLTPLIDKFAYAMDEALDSQNSAAVRRLSESFKHVSDVLHKTLAIDGTLVKPSLAKEEAQEEKSTGKQPWISVVSTGPISVATPKELPKEKPAIDVEIEGTIDDG